MQNIRRWMDRLPAPTAESPDPYNAFYVTNFAPHYAGDDIAQAGDWAAVVPLFARQPLSFELTGPLENALNNYHRVPEIGLDGELR